MKRIILAFIVIVGCSNLPKEAKTVIETNCPILCAQALKAKCDTETSRDACENACELFKASLDCATRDGLEIEKESTDASTIPPRRFTACVMNRDTEIATRYRGREETFHDSKSGSGGPVNSPEPAVNSMKRYSQKE